MLEVMVEVGLFLSLVPEGKVICFEALPLYSKALRNVVSLSKKYLMLKMQQF